MHITTNFTFLTGASHPEEYVEQAAELGYRAIAVTDVNSLAGVVRGHIAAKEPGVQFIVGCRLEMSLEHSQQDEVAETQSAHLASSSPHLSVAPSPSSILSVLVYPTDRAAYGRLCRLLTLGRRRAPKGRCFLAVHDLLEHQEGLLAVVIPPRVIDQPFLEALEGLAGTFDDDRLSLASSCLYGEDDRARLRQLIALSGHVRVPLVATNDVHYHVPQRRALQDVLTCIRHGCTMTNAGFRLFPHAERVLKPPHEMARLLADCPQAVARTIAIAERAAGFDLDQLHYEYPDEVCPSGMIPMEHLITLTRRGAAERYPRGVPDKVLAQIEHEFALINELHYAPYFLTCYDIITFARSRGILCQGRGAAANSAVCYCLGITSVDPDRIDLLFERFVSRERNEPPDIDIDFEHERREEVIQYIYNKYGRDRAALTAEVITYRGRSAIREVGKALGLSLDCVDRLSKSLDWWDKGVVNEERVRGLGINPDDPTMQHLIALAGELLGFPRHLSQHVGGFVISRGPLCESVPIENAAMDDRTVIEWDKDDIDALGMLKIDCLGLGMLTCIRKGFEFLALHHGLHLTLASVPAEDPAVYDMLCRADAVGVFQVESRAQMSMLPRLRPREFYDLVIEVAIVRPGPIQGKMVHPYLRRRAGEESVSYPDEKVERVLKKTLGVPLFQEQAMQLAIVAAGFTPDEADQLRRAMAAWKRKGDQLHRFGDRLIGGMIERGYKRDFAERCFEQIKGFSEYGFPESHAASFALLVYVSAWLKCHYPAAFAAALINSQPMGFYAPAQIIRDALEHGVEVRAVDVNFSQWDCTLEEGTEQQSNERIERSDLSRTCHISASFSSLAIRLGMRLVKGLREDDARAIVAAIHGHGPFRTIDDLHRAGGVRIAPLRRLAAADAFNSMGLDRQHALWELRGLRDECLPLFDGKETRFAATHAQHGDRRPEDEDTERRRGDIPSLPEIPPSRVVIHDYASIGLSLKAHPVSFIRKHLDVRQVTPNGHLRDEARCPNGKRIAVAGIVLCRQRPGTASGIVFITLEDETGVANLIVRPKVYQRYRKAARHGITVLARGIVERQGDVVHVMVRQIEDLDDVLRPLPGRSRDFR